MAARNKIETNALFYISSPRRVKQHGARRTATGPQNPVRTRSASRAEASAKPEVAHNPG